MTREPSFDELVGGEPTGTERERLRRAHELLMRAGPPPELPPELADGPQLKRVQARRRREVKRRSLILLAAAVAVAAVFFAGFAVGNRGGSSNAAAVLPLKGTAAVPHARATLTIFHHTAGNWPMRLIVQGLPKSSTRSYYTVLLVRKNGERLPCGGFVNTGGDKPLTVSLNAPWTHRPGDTWIVARESEATGHVGATVLRPA